MRHPAKLCAAAAALILAGSAVSFTARAQETPPVAAGSAASESAQLEQARALYLQGLEHVRGAQWGDALVAFQGSRALRPHALTSYNIGACERALGHYTRAHQELTRALAEGTGSELPSELVADARVFLQEIRDLLVHITLQVEPAGASISFDGRPLARMTDADGQAWFIAGVSPPGRGEAIGGAQLRIIADPGAHVLTLSRHGYGEIVLNRTYRPGQIASERLVLSELPAVIRVSSNERLAVVSVNGKDVGLAPVDVLRPAGLYRVQVTKSGFVHYGADVRVMAGQETALRATLVRERPSVLGRWWFWTGAAVLASGVATATFFATRDNSPGQRPALDGGSLGWVAKLK